MASWGVPWAPPPDLTASGFGSEELVLIPDVSPSNRAHVDSIDDPMSDEFGILELVFGDEVTGPPSRPVPPFFFTPAGDGVVNVGLLDITKMRFLTRFD